MRGLTAEIIHASELGPVRGKPGSGARRLGVTDLLLHEAHLSGSLEELTRFPGREELGGQDCPWGGNTEEVPTSTHTSERRRGFV